MAAHLITDEQIRLFDSPEGIEAFQKHLEQLKAQEVLEDANKLTIPGEVYDELRNLSLSPTAVSTNDGIHAPRMNRATRRALQSNMRKRRK